MQELSEKTAFAEFLIDSFKGEDKVGKSIDLRKHRTYSNLFRDISAEHSDVLALFLQALVERFEELGKNATRRPATTEIGKIAKTLEAAHYFRTPNQTKEAVANIMCECERTAYASTPDAPLVGPSIAHWPYSDYKFIGSSSVISLPPYDNTKLCHWAVLAHEVFHSKFYNIEKSLDNLGKAKLLSDEKLRRESVGLLDKLLPGKNAFRKLDDLRATMTKALKIRTGEKYRMLYQTRIKDDFCISYYYLDNQFEEIVCDIAAVLAAGPAYVAVSCMEVADRIRQPDYDVSRHLYFDLAHPPEVCRILYQIEALEDRGLCLKSKAVEELIGTVNILLHSDLTGRRKSLAEKSSEEFLKLYLDTIIDRNLWPQIMEVVDLLVNEDFRFDQKRWDRIVASYEQINLKPEAEFKDALPFDYVNMAWLRLMDISDGLGYEEYCRAYDDSRLFFNNIWDRVRHLTVK